MGQKRLRTTD